MRFFGIVHLRSARAISKPPTASLVDDAVDDKIFTTQLPSRANLGWLCRRRRRNLAVAVCGGNILLLAGRISDATWWTYPRSKVPAMASETHLLILRPRSAVTACGKHLVAIYPHTATAQPAGLEGHIKYTILLHEVTCPDVPRG